MASADFTLCPDCGRSIPRDAVRGLCMACMVRGSLPGFFEEPGIGLPDADAAGPECSLPRCGEWEAVSRAGEGAFGLVYEAVQSGPLHRRAALKVLKPGLDSREVLTRFATEREALALLDHPGIARVLDAGTEDGRPWFAAEWVEGARTLVEYCQEKEVSRTGRVQLFQEVCDAIAHAHQRGIIHRDLKPSNLLVSAGGAVKVIDFGIARATERVLAQSTLVTLAGQVLGTPAWMSPEQAAGHGAEADTRSDIYSLGAVLYELLTDQTPFPLARLDRATLQEALRIVVEESPPKPSTHDVTLRGELEWITLKALEKEPARRYETAAALARDLERWREGGTVLAAPPSRAYQFRTFLRRHRTAAIGAVAVFLALLAGLAATTLMYLRADRAAAAEAAERGRAEDELWKSLVVSAQREGKSGIAGSSTRALEIVRRAAAIRPSVELRDEVIAAMVRPDYGPERLVSWQGVAPRLKWRNPVFSPDLSTAGVLREDRSMVLLDVETGQERLTFSGLPLVPDSQGPSFSPGGKWLAVWDRLPRAELAGELFPGTPRGKALAVLSSPAAAGAVARGAAGILTSRCNLRIWSIADGTEKFLDADPVREFTWNRDDSVLALLRADSIERFRMPECRSLGQCALPPGWSGPGLSPDGQRIAIGYGGRVEIRDCGSGELLHTLSHQHATVYCVWNADGALLAVGGHDQRLHIWDTATGLKWAECNGHDGRPSGQDFLPGTDLLLSGSWDNTLRMWSPRSGRPLLVQPAAEGTWVPGSGGSMVSLARWPVLALRQLRLPEGLRTARRPASPDQTDTGVQDVAFSQDGRLLFTAGKGGVDAWETADLRYLGGMSGVGDMVSVMPLGDDSLTYTDGTGVHRVRVEWSPGAEAIRFGPAVDTGPRLRCNHADLQGGTLAVSCVTAEARFGEHIEVWRDGQRRSAWDFVEDRDSAETFLGSWPPVAVSPDGAWLATGGNGLCRPLLLATDAGPCADSREVRLGAEYHRGAHCSFSPDSRTLAVQSLLTVSLWDVGSRKMRHRISRPAGSQGFLTAFSPDGKLLAAMGPAWDIWLLDPANGERLATLTPPEPALTAALCFSPDSTRLAAALVNNTVQVWDLPALRRGLLREGLDWSEGR